MDSNITYHLSELEIAYDPHSPHYIMPEFTDNDNIILDIGCGIGQTFVGAKLQGNRILVGIDVDLQSLTYGHHRFCSLNFICGTAEQLPFKDASFDFAFSRVALPYTYIPQALNEISRVLKSNGRVWLALHPFTIAAEELKKSICKFDIKGIIYRTYVIVNGILLHLFDKSFILPIKNKHETFQTKHSILRFLEKAGFTESCVQTGSHFICTAWKKTTL